MDWRLAEGDLQQSPSVLSGNHALRTGDIRPRGENPEDGVSTSDVVERYQVLKSDRRAHSEQVCRQPSARQIHRDVDAELWAAPISAVRTGGHLNTVGATGTKVRHGIGERCAETGDAIIRSRRSR